MEAVEDMGYLASALSIASGLPQALKTFRTKSAGDLALATLLLQIVAHVLWIVYAIEYRLWPVLAPNLCSFAVVLTITGLKLSYDRRLRLEKP
jgi:MtN3 and saliva related transmembrane protein